MLQTLNRDPRLRKVETVVKPSTALNDDVKHPVIKNKEDKKLDKPKRDNSKHRDSKRKERSPSHSPSKKELSRKSHKKPDRKERSPRDDKYHKRRDDKKNKELEVKKKNQSGNMKVLQNETVVTINREISPKNDEPLFKEEPIHDNLNTNLTNIKPIELNVPKEKDVNIEVVNEADINNSTSIDSELSKNDSSLEDSDSLKRLHKYMQTMKKSPEPSTAPPVELKNESDIHAVKSNQSKIKMSDKLYIIIKFIVGDVLLFLNKLDTILRHNKTISPFHKVLSS